MPAGLEKKNAYLEKTLTKVDNCHWTLFLIVTEQLLLGVFQHRPHRLIDQLDQLRIGTGLGRELEKQDAMGLEQRLQVRRGGFRKFLLRLPALLRAGGDIVQELLLPLPLPAHPAPVR